MTLADLGPNPYTSSGDDDELVRAVSGLPPEADVEAEVSRLMLRDEAKRRHAERTAPVVTLPAIVGLTDFLAVHDDPVTYLIDRLAPSRGNILLAAQYKAGKTTLRDNMVRALADGMPFLGTFEVPETKRVVIIDAELEEATLRRWLRDQDIRNTGRVSVVSLKGQIGSFDILDPNTRAAWADVLRGNDVLVFDCLRPVLDALGLSEHTEAGRFLVALDALKREAGMESTTLVHHYGHGAERSRGDSRILDWADTIWNLNRDDVNDPASPRFLMAYGRDVDVPQGALTFDPETRALSYEEGGQRTSGIARARDAVAELLSDSVEPWTVRGLESHFRGLHKREVFREGLAEGVSTGLFTVTNGARGANFYTLTSKLITESGVES